MRLGTRALPRHSQEALPDNKGRRSAERRISPRCRIGGCGCAPRQANVATRLRFGRARLPALHRGACHANQCRGSAQAVFPATCAAAGVTRRALSQSSDAPRRPVVVPADSMPEPPGSGVYRPARGNRTRSAFGSTLAKASLTSELPLRNRLSDKCQGPVTERDTEQPKQAERPMGATAETRSEVCAFFSPRTACRPR